MKEKIDKHIGNGENVCDLKKPLDFGKKLGIADLGSPNIKRKLGFSLTDIPGANAENQIEQLKISTTMATHTGLEKFG
jgi:hypothetical protein